MQRKCKVDAKVDINQMQSRYKKDSKQIKGKYKRDTKFERYKLYKQNACNIVTNCRHKVSGQVRSRYE